MSFDERAPTRPTRHLIVVASVFVLSLAACPGTLEEPSKYEDLTNDAAIDATDAPPTTDAADASTSD